MRYTLRHIAVSIVMLVVALVMAGAHDAFGDDFKKKKKKKKKKKGKTEQVDQGPQDPGIAIADEYYNNYEYYQAAVEYKKVLDRDPTNKYATYMAAESYREYFDYKNAEHYYKKTLEIAHAEYPLARYWYATMLMNNGHYPQAKTQYTQFLAEYKATDLEAETTKERARQAIRNSDFAIAELKKPLRDFNFKCLPEPVNTESSEYSPVISTNDTTLILTSARAESTGGEQNTSFGGTFSDNFRFRKTAAGWEAINDDDRFSVTNTRFNESSGSFTYDHKKFYFTRCDEEVKVGKYTDFVCAIYMVEKKDSVWQTPVRLNANINPEGEWNAQPSISPDGNLLFFVSKRKGGIGMHDIWYSINTGGENWGPAVNLGPDVNTLFVDMSPRYYGEQQLLFFSSNGHPGFGGLDIFMTSEADEFTTVKNVGLPFNSNSDDFYFVLGEKKGYVTSNRQGGVGNDDVYTFDMESRELLIAFINKDSLSGANSVTVEGKMQKDDKSPAVNETVCLTDVDGNILKTTVTNEDGYYKFDNLPADQSYKVVLKQRDNLLATQRYITDTIAVRKSDKHPTRIHFENIYFDFDMYELRPEAIKVLDELVVYIKAHPEVQVEIYANTDSLGSLDYNKRLSIRRGDAATSYLHSKGIDRKHLVINAVAYERPLAANNNPTGRQLNRRVEFYILGGEGYNATAMTYIVEPGASVSGVAKKFGMTVEEIKALNGLESDTLLPYRPLRVRRIGDNDLIAPVTRADAAKPEKQNSKYYLERQNRQRAYENGIAQNNSDRQQAYAMYQERYHAQQAAKHSVLKRKLLPGEDVYEVQRSNTLFSIARLYGMKVTDLKTLNELSSDTIYVNQKLIVKYPTVDPGPQYHIVKDGETVEIIASLYNVSPADIRKWNGLDGYILKKNMLIRVKE